VFEVAFIQEKGSGRLMPESGLVRDHCVQIGLPIELYTPKRIHRRQLPLTRTCFVFGDMDCKRYSVPTFRGLLSRAMIAHEPRSL